MSSNAPQSPHPFRAFKLHKVSFVEEETVTMQVFLPHLQGVTTHHIVTYQKTQMIPELCDQDTISVALAVADEEHWNIVNDPIYPACLATFKSRHQRSLSRNQGWGEKVSLWRQLFPQQPAPNLRAHQLQTMRSGNRCTRSCFRCLP